jgi:hypothetical protein
VWFVKNSPRNILIVRPQNKICVGFNTRHISMNYSVDLKLHSKMSVLNDFMYTLVEFNIVVYALWFTCSHSL